MAPKRLVSGGLVGSLVLVVGCLLAFSPRPLAASESIATAEGRECTSCHTRPKGKRLNDRGRYYELTGSLAGYEELDRRFKSCSACHRGKPGSVKLTVTGRRYRWFFEDMEGVRAWVMARHPDQPRTSDEPEKRTRADHLNDG